jgi:serine phosphatase RsbU (regulator of sigma subunit)
VNFASCRIELLPGDAIVLYSDGLLDVQIDGARVEEEWVGQLLRSATTTAAGALIDRVTDTLQRLEQPLRDDVAIMALSRPIA